jgi:hypothetical protein
MGLLMTNGKTEFSIGYIGYGNMLAAILNAHTAGSGKKWLKAASNATRGGGETGYCLPDEIEDMKILLNHSDCDGKLTPRECRKIYSAIKTINCDYPRYGEFREAFRRFSNERRVVRFL